MTAPHWLPPASKAADRLIPDPKEWVGRGFWYVLCTQMNCFMHMLSPGQMSTFLQHLLDKDEQDDSCPPFVYEPGETPADILGSVQDAVVDLVRYALERDRQIEALQAELRRRDREIFAGRQAMRDAEGATKH